MTAEEVDAQDETADTARRAGIVRIAGTALVGGVLLLTGAAAGVVLT